MMKVSFYSLYSDKKQILAPPDMCPLRKKLTKLLICIYCGHVQGLNKMAIKAGFGKCDCRPSAPFFQLQHLPFPYTQMSSLTRNAPVKRSSDGEVVIAHASHLRGPGSGHEWVKLVVGSLICSQRFFSVFPLS